MAKQFEIDTGGTLTTNLQHYYKLEDVNDFYGTDNLTNVGTATFAAGKVNNAVDLGSGNSSKYLKNTTNYGINGAFSWAGWVKLKAEITGSDTNWYFFNLCNTTNHVEYLLLYQFNGGTQRVIFNRSRDGVAGDQFTYNLTMGTANWYHLVYTYDGSTVEGWVNGSSVGTVGSSGNGSGGASDGFAIGQTIALNGYASAMFDEVSWWTKKLSNTEIADLYNAGSGQTMEEVANTRRSLAVLGVA